MLTDVKVGGIRCIEILCVEQGSEPSKADGGSGAEPRRYGDLTAFSKKNTNF